MNKIKFFIFFTVVLLVSLPAISQIKLPIVNNFNIKDYKAGNQNWSVESIGGYVYIGNNEGLLEFDGLNWYLHQLPNKNIVRSVKVIGDRIYTGSYEEFGYWDRLKTGMLKYTSLSKKLPFKDIDSQSIWDIYDFNDKVIFKSFAAIYIFSDTTFKIIKPGYILMTASVINNRFITQGKGIGLLELKDDKLVFISGTEEIGSYRVQSIISIEDDNFVIGTDLNGCFTYSNGKVENWKSSFNNLLKEHEINTLSYLNDKIYVGTIKNGIYIYSLKNKSYQNINIANGLQNNTILDSYIDKSNMLWLALDNGVSSVNLDSDTYYLNPFKENIGAVYDMVKLGNEVYLATNTGVFKVDDDGVFFINGSQGHTWSLELVGNQIICCHNSGTFVIEDGKFSQLSSETGGYVFNRIPESNHKYIQGDYLGLTLFEKNNNVWKTTKIEKLNFPVKNIIFESPHIAWVSHAYKGIYKIFFSENYEEVIRIEEKYNKFFTNIYDIKLFSIDRNIAFFGNEKWYVYNSLEDKIEEFNSLNKILGKDQHSVVLNDFSEEMLVLRNYDNSIFIRKNLNDSNSQKYLQKEYYDNKLVRGEGDQKALVVNDSLVYIALYNDVLVVNTNKLGGKYPLERPKVSRLLVNGIPQGLDYQLRLNKRDTLQLELSVPYNSNYSIEYSLQNKKWINSNGNISLSGVGYGSSNLKLRSSFGTDQFSEVYNIPLYGEYPWYLGVWGMVLGILIIILILFSIRTINKYVLIKHKNYLENQYNHEQEIFKNEEALKNEIQMNELKTRQHEVELDSKTKELANTAMLMTKKDEILELIIEDLQFFKNEIISKSKFEKLLTTINRNINTAKDWEVFDSNFNEIHESFFNALMNSNFQLSSKDLKLCAYLKMNLATKEIAPLMGISARGVEIHRYRLRKKLNLSKDQNLNEYFMSIS